MALPKPQYPVFKTILPTTDETVWLRPYLVKEQKILQTLAESNDPVEIAQNLKNLIQSCWSSPENFNFNKLTVYDIQWLALRLREASVGDQIEQTYICKNRVEGSDTPCNNEIKIKFKLSDVKYIKPENPIFPNNIIQIRDNLGIKMNYPRIHEQILGDNIDYEKLLQMIAKDLEYVFDEENTYPEFTTEEAIEFLRTLKVDEFAKILEFYDEKNLPTLKLEIPYKCGKCQHEGKIVLSNLFDFFSF